MSDNRPCTCHPDDNPPVPCERKYAFTECRISQLERELTQAKAELSTLRAECERLRDERDALRDAGSALLQWDHEHPAHRIYNSTEHKQLESALTAIVEKFRPLCAARKAQP